MQQLPKIPNHKFESERNYMSNLIHNSNTTPYTDNRSVNPKNMRARIVRLLNSEQKCLGMTFPQKYYTALKSYYYDANIIKFPFEYFSFTAQSLFFFLFASSSPLVDFARNDVMFGCVPRKSSWITHPKKHIEQHFVFPFLALCTLPCPYSKLVECKSCFEA